MSKYYIYFNNWWGGFFNGSDKCNIEFFKRLFTLTNIKNFEITNDINKANILFESGKPDDKILKLKKWKYTIIFNAEPTMPIYENHDIIINSLEESIYKDYNNFLVNNINCENMGFIVLDDEKKMIEKHKFIKSKHLQLGNGLWYIHGNNYLERLRIRPTITTIPPYFCCFIVSNGKCHVRNKMFHKLSKYKKVHSGGRYCNNLGRTVSGDWKSESILNFIGKHKFVICFENSLFNPFTEKIVNAYLARSIPIYWSAKFMKTVFNPESMIFLEDTSDKSYQNVIDKVIEIDNDDSKYLEMINKPLFNSKNERFWNENFSLAALGSKFNRLFNR